MAVVDSSDKLLCKIPVMFLCFIKNHLNVLVISFVTVQGKVLGKQVAGLIPFGIFLRAILQNCAIEIDGKPSHAI